MKDYQPHGARAYQRWIKLFLYFSGLFREGFDPQDRQPSRLIIGQLSIVRSWRKVSQAPRRGDIRSSAPCAPVSPTRNCLRRKQNRPQPDRVESRTPVLGTRQTPHRTGQGRCELSGRHRSPHRADDYRRFLGLIHRVCPGLLDLSPEQRFLASNLSSHLDKALAGLRSFEQFQRLHLIAEGLNDHFASGITPGFGTQFSRTKTAWPFAGRKALRSPQGARPASAPRICGMSHFSPSWIGQFRHWRRQNPGSGMSGDQAWVAPAL